MSLREQYLEAARYLAEREADDEVGACFALIVAPSYGDDRPSMDDRDAACKTLELLFAPDCSERSRYNHGSAWWGRSYKESPADNQHFRVLMLCFAAEVA